MLWQSHQECWSKNNVACGVCCCFLNIWKLVTFLEVDQTTHIPKVSYMLKHLAESRPEWAYAWMLIPYHGWSSTIVIYQRNAHISRAPTLLCLVTWLITQHLYDFIKSQSKPFHFVVKEHLTALWDKRCLWGYCFPAMHRERKKREVNNVTLKNALAGMI